jgi:hypothetical protein
VRGVEGTWHVISNPRAPAQTTQGIWRIRRACSPGPCRLTVKSSTGEAYHFGVKEATGTYTRAITLSATCTPRSARRAGIKQVYSETATTSLRVVSTVTNNGKGYATEMVGDSLARPVSPQATNQCRENPVRRFDLRAFRADRPRQTARPNPRGGGEESPVEQLLAKVPGVQPSQQPRPPQRPDAARPQPQAQPWKANPPKQDPSRGPTNDAPQSLVERLLDQIPGING